MKIKKALPVVLIAVAAFALGSANASGKNAPTEGEHYTGSHSSYAFNKGFSGQRGYGHHQGFGRRGDSAMQQQLFKQIDANSDGSISQEEMDTFRAAKVAAADLNKDGALSLEEFDTLYRELTRTHMVRAFQNLDSNGDGVISAEEMDARVAAIMQRMERKGERRN